MSWREEHAGRSREDYESKQEYRQYHGFKDFIDDDDLKGNGVRMITYLPVTKSENKSDKKEAKKSFDKLWKGIKIVDGKLVENDYHLKVDYDKLVNTKWAVTRLKETFYTKSGAVRKINSDVKGCKGYKTYMIQSLMHYLNQCHSEGKSNCILSYSEYNMLVSGKIEYKKK